MDELVSGLDILFSTKTLSWWEKQYSGRDRAFQYGGFVLVLYFLIFLPHGVFVFRTVGVTRHKKSITHDEEKNKNRKNYNKLKSLEVYRAFLLYVIIARTQYTYYVYNIEYYDGVRV